MASTIKVTISREKSPQRPSHKLSESFSCADRHPGADVLRDCQSQVTAKFNELYGEGSVTTTIVVT